MYRYKDVAKVRGHNTRKWRVEYRTSVENKKHCPDEFVHFHSVYLYYRGQDHAGD